MMPSSQLSSFFIMSSLILVLLSSVTQIFVRTTLCAYFPLSLTLFSLLLLPVDSFLVSSDAFLVVAPPAWTVGPFSEMECE